MNTTVLTRDTEQAALRARRGVRRLILAAAIVAVAAGAAVTGRDWWVDGRFIESTDDSYVGGNVTALSPHVAGFVAAILVADNAHVHAGDLLIRLDDRDARAALDHATAARAVADKRLASLQAQRALREEAIAQDRAELGSRAADAVFATADAGRYQALLGTVAGTRQLAERTRAADAAARYQVEAARASVASAEAALGVLDADIAGARANVDVAEADLRVARLDLAYTEIRAPTDGYVANRAAERGAYVTRGTYLLSVVPDRGLWVDANFKEDQIGRMAKGDRAEVTIDAAPGRILRGHVESLADGTGAVFSIIPPENATGNFTKIVQRLPVRIHIDDASAETILRPGLSAIVRVDTRLGR